MRARAVLQQRARRTNCKACFTCIADAKPAPATPAATSSTALGALPESMNVTNDDAVNGTDNDALLCATSTKRASSRRMMHSPDSYS
jgi:hypothetical protein